MIRDPILAEVRRTRRQIEAEHGNDLEKIAAHYMKRQAGAVEAPPAGKARPSRRSRRPKP